MIWFKRIFAFLFVIISLLLALAFMTANETKVSIDFFVWEGSATIGIWVVAAFMMGLIVTLVASYPLIAAYRFRLHRAQKKQLELAVSHSTAVSKTT